MTSRGFANGILGGMALLLGLAGLYGLARGGWVGAPIETAVTLVGGVVSALALRLDEGKRVGVAIALVSTLAALWTGDAVVAKTLPNSPNDRRREAARVAGVAMDPRSTLDVVRDLRRSGFDAWPTMYLGNHWETRAEFRDTLYPLASMSGVVSVMCSEGPYVVYRADEHGFPNPPGQWGRAPEELALVGDSYVLGWCVRPPESFTGRIRTKHPATIVLGQGASGPLSELAMMKEYLPLLHPRRVLWFYYEKNDLADLDAEKRHPILVRYLEGGFTQGLLTRQAEIDRRLRAYAVDAESLADGAARSGLLRGVWSVLTLSHLWGLGTNGQSAPQRPCCDLPLLRRVAQAMQATVHTWGGDLTMVYLPSEARIAGRPRGAGEQAADSVIAIMKTLGVPVLDLRDSLRRFGSARELYPYENAHLTARGHAAVATIVLRYLAGPASEGPTGNHPKQPPRPPEGRTPTPPQDHPGVISAELPSRPRDGLTTDDP